MHYWAEVIGLIVTGWHTVSIMTVTTSSLSKCPYQSDKYCVYEALQFVDYYGENLIGNPSKHLCNNSAFTHTINVLIFTHLITQL